MPIPSSHSAPHFIMNEPINIRQLIIDTISLCVGCALTGLSTPCILCSLVLRRPFVDVHLAFLHFEFKHSTV